MSNPTFNSPLHQPSKGPVSYAPTTLYHPTNAFTHFKHSKAFIVVISISLGLLVVLFLYCACRSTKSSTLQLLPMPTLDLLPWHKLWTLSLVIQRSWIWTMKHHLMFQPSNWKVLEVSFSTYKKLKNVIFFAVLSILVKLKILLF
jgi:hypothetical protein